MTTRVMDEARRVAPAAPQGQKRILAIDHPIVYRLRHGRWRGATWLEDDAARFWLLAGAHREAGSRDDAYEVFAALREAGSLLPDDNDRDRDVVERNARLRTAAIAALPVAVADAVMRREEDIPIRIADRVDTRVFVSAAGDEVWVAVATREADGSFIDEPVRDVLFRLAFDAAGAEIWELRSDWPSARSNGSRSRAWGYATRASGPTSRRRDERCLPR